MNNIFSMSNIPTLSRVSKRTEPVGVADVATSDDSMIQSNVSAKSSRCEKNLKKCKSSLKKERKNKNTWKKRAKDLGYGSRRRTRRGGYRGRGRRYQRKYAGRHLITPTGGGYGGGWAPAGAFPNVSRYRHVRTAMAPSFMGQDESFTSKYGNILAVIAMFGIGGFLLHLAFKAEPSKGG